ncbi:hypothetical protein [Leptothoe sp. PORK10 BA2]|uniref:hypothetical protein n=1 Tax=Leptothoe sp. PORK10 BA2 TaxID=3110254 RepID=UPI002B2043F4|nr:hypothetical protein [Leptothoe sp. PORK10 BA2]MEA5463631.1 hypothetical protein [Leptothoe sp. PORK10 BA2]
MNYFSEKNSEFSCALNEFTLFQASPLPLWHFVAATLVAPHTAASQSYGCASSDGSSPRLVAALLQRGADINCPNHLAETPLIATAKGIYFDADAAASLRLLVEAGADRQYRDCDGKQAIDYLREMYQIWFDTTVLATLAHQDFYTYWADRLEDDDFKTYDLPEYVPAELRTLTQSIKLLL